MITFPGLVGVAAEVVGVEGSGLELFSLIGAGEGIDCTKTDIL